MPAMTDAVVEFVGTLPDCISCTESSEHDLRAERILRSFSPRVHS